MASGHTGNVVPGNRLRVRIPCPPLVACCWIAHSSRIWELPFRNRLRADEPLPATRAAAHSPAAVDSSSRIDVLAQHEAHFAAFHVEYVSVDRRDDGAAESEERVEFARDAQAGRWFRKRNVTGSRYGVFARLVIIDRHGDVVGSCS